ncbi:MAG: hypothetical protein ACXVEU_09910 [Nocardioidaceae bacterium]
MRNAPSAAPNESIPVDERVTRLSSYLRERTDADATADAIERVADLRSALIPLRVLDANLREARAMVAEQRRDPRGPWGAGPPSARQAMLLALEAYADGLAARRLPVPYLLRDELRLHQRLYR